MRRQSQRTKSVGRAALFVPLAALLAAGCSSNGSPKTADVPDTAYLAVVQNYDVPIGKGGPRQLRYTVTDRKTIAQLTALINALPAAPKQSNPPSCPEEVAPAFDLQFQDTKGGKVLAQVDFECFGVWVTLDGKDEPLLSSSTSPGAPSLINRVEAILAPYAKSAES
ncbi:hypothetical protein [Actinospica robiniae]|uniref:hypothetical protein n=1 Tax=Actinospica robiniae TaxID=304901 RepID=UPI00041BAAA4|nr:hypothetical protein [Actinospica robiniae]